MWRLTFSLKFLLCLFTSIWPVIQNSGEISSYKFSGQNLWNFKMRFSKICLTSIPLLGPKLLLLDRRISNRVSIFMFILINCILRNFLTITLELVLDCQNEGLSCNEYQDLVCFWLNVNYLRFNLPNALSKWPRNWSNQAINKNLYK